MRPSSPIMAVLRSVDMFGTICGFQLGLWEDALRFRRLVCPALDNMYPYGDLSIWRLDCPKYTSSYNMLDRYDALAALLLPWVDLHGVSRIVRLMDALPHMKTIWIHVAIYSNWQYVVQVLHDTYGLRPVNDDLFEVAVAGGHVAMVEFLTRLGLSITKLGPAHRAAHLTRTDMLVFLWHRRAFAAGDAYILLELSRHGQVDALRWLYQEWAPLMDEGGRAGLVTWMLRFASKWGQVSVAKWLAECSDSHTSLSPSLALLDEMVQRDLYYQCFRHALWNGYVAMLEWLVDDGRMLADDIQVILARDGLMAMEKAARDGSEPMAALLLALGMALPVEVLFVAATHGHLNMVTFLLRVAMPRMDVRTRGDFVVRMVQLTTSDDHTTMLHSVYDTWVSLVDGDDVEAARVQQECLADAAALWGNHALRVLRSKGLVMLEEEASNESWQLKATAAPTTRLEPVVHSFANWV
ncbi:Aste57867_21160 [Aphanomyces stellatus]|uniref:Aste57867_21160 protein n=1 Tax=Aphanomyces stellatus TaxID=120398 RepID=A0A485LGV9_9STRA|nr:hypothetical protein As57867_021092 [Aphanomyces stellatus]VFT97834.1 Aste57867_21160 [Aphanomyces stellatus]